MKGLTLSFGLAALACLTIVGMAQDTASEEAPDISYSFTFKTKNFPHDTFTQLLGINNANTIAGYHGSGQTGHPNKGFILALPETFVPENFPKSVQTQVIGINTLGKTDGFYIDTAGINHGFTDVAGVFHTVDFPGTTFNQLLGLNDLDQQAGFWTDSAGNNHGYITDGGVTFLVLTIPGVATTTVSGINNKGSLSGFYTEAGVTHGFVLVGGKFTILTFPGSTSTSALGLNNIGQVVGTYTDTSGVHGFIWTAAAGFAKVDDPSGIGATMINGINDKGWIVGFFGPCATGLFTCDGFVGIPAR